jgi:hypothetical protein
MNNILYILNHKTLTDYEIPILINKGYGVFIVKNYASFNKLNSLYENCDFYDNFLNLDHKIIKKLNEIDWYKNNKLSDELIDIININFKFIFLTVLTSGELIEQLIDKYKGIICYRFFGRESNYRYDKLIPKITQKIKFIFSYQEIYNFEISHDNYFNYQNSYIIPLGISNMLINKIIKTYKPSINRICFICSKIGNCNYYTNVYNNFINNFASFNYIILGKNNIIKNDAIINNLCDDDYYDEISKSKLMYYHGTEPRHLHYHPLEGMIIGIPIIFYEKSLLNRYLKDSPGKCTTTKEAIEKINKILNDDNEFIKSIVEKQNQNIDSLTSFTNQHTFDKIINDNI